MRQVHFLIPDPATFISGGNVYNAHLMRALIDQGVHISHGIFRPEVMLSSRDTLYILDSIYFEKIDAPDHQIPDRSVGLIHHLSSLYPFSEEYFQLKEKRILSHFAGFIVTSAFTFRYLTDYGFDPSRIYLIEPAPCLSLPTGQASGGQASIQSKVQRQPSRVVNALMLGSCVPRKGQLAFLRSLAAADLPPSYIVIIAGSLEVDKDYARSCAEVIENNHNLKARVQLIGEQNASAIRYLYTHSNLYLSSSEMETFGMAIQDAVVCGIPVLALEGGFAAEHVSHGFNGYRCQTHEKLVAEFGKCVIDSDHFLALQERSIAFEHQYHTWAEGATTLIDTFIESG